MRLQQPTGVKAWLRALVVGVVSVSLLGIAPAAMADEPPVPTDTTETTAPALPDPDPAPTTPAVKPAVTIKVPQQRRVGAALDVSGRLAGFAGKVTLKAQVYTQGAWRTDAQATVTAKAAGTDYKLSVADKIKQPRANKWRVLATQGSTEVKSDKPSVQRLPLWSVTAATTGVKVDQTAYATGEVVGYAGKVTLKAQVYTKGAWKTKATKAITADYFGTPYKIELPYAEGKAGSTTWRVLLVQGSGTRKSNKITLNRAGENIDSRCLTGRTLCVSKKDRKVRWMINGDVKKTFDARFGKSSTPTRNGSYQVFRKSRDHVSSLYHSSMPFAMFFSGGQAIHYSPDFARNGYSGASHGCVNIRDYNGIKSVFGQVKIGDKVVVY